MTPVTNTPNPRDVSNEVGAQGGLPVPPSRLNLSSWFTFTGQFLDHDFTLGLPPNPAESPNPIEHFDIHIPNGDPTFPDGSEVPLERNDFVIVDGVRQQINTQSAWLDITATYGANLTFANQLRANDSGLLLSDEDDPNLLPRFSRFPIQFPNDQDTEEERIRFRGGDERTNENLALTTLQHLFWREHNRLARRFKEINPWMSDQELYHAARNYNIALFQKIIVYDWLPNMIGQDMWDREIRPFKNRRRIIENANLPNEFSNAVFRVGHPLLPQNFPVIDENNNTLQTLQLRNMFEQADMFDDDFMNNFARGMLRTFAKDRNRFIVDDVRNFLFLAPNVTVTLDLFSLNLQRALDHGIPDYKQLRKELRLPKAYGNFGWSDDADTRNRLNNAYGGNDNIVHAWVGILTEEPVADDAVLGPVGAKVLVETFRPVRNNDRLWFERIWGIPNLIEEICDTTIADLIRRNTDLSDSEVQDDAFVIGEQNFRRPPGCK